MLVSFGGGEGRGKSRGRGVNGRAKHPQSDTRGSGPSYFYGGRFTYWIDNLRWLTVLLEILENAV